jgi:hypothetical protein
MSAVAMSTVVNALPGVPDVESPLFESIFASKNLPPETLEIARKLREDGFAVFDFPEPEFDRVADTIIRTLEPRYDWDAWRKGETADLRVQDAWETVPEVKQIACNPKILKLLSDLYGRRAFPFQTLNFPVGTQQHFHTDSVHFSSCPERFMVGVWVALEDIDADNGPLIYYPGSHKLPIFTNEHIGRNPDIGGPNRYNNYPLYQKAWEAIVDALGFQPLYFHAKKGQALIWSANLLHGGAAQRDMNRTRYSQVTHYYFERCCYYTPLHSVPFLGRIEYREIRDIATGETVPNQVNGVPVPEPEALAASPVPAAPGLPPQIRRLLRPIKRFLVGSSPPPPIPAPPGFDADAYLKANPDVAASGVDPVRHWLEFGQREGRPMR